MKLDRISSLEDVASFIIDMEVKYCGCKPSDFNKNDIISDFVNDDDIESYLEDLPINEETASLFEYILLAAEHSDKNREYVEMVLNDGVSIDALKRDVYSNNEVFFDGKFETDFSFSYTFDHCESKFEFYKLFVDEFKNWHGYDEWVNCKPIQEIEVQTSNTEDAHIVAALMAAYYASAMEAAGLIFNDSNEFGGDSITHLYEYLEIGKNIEIPYEDGLIDTETLRENIYQAVKDKYKEEQLCF